MFATYELPFKTQSQLEIAQATKAKYFQTMGFRQLYISLEAALYTAA